MSWLQLKIWLRLYAMDKVLIIATKKKELQILKIQKVLIATKIIIK